ncbi:flagellar hook-basal body complex protein FliE [Microbacterium sp. zg.Y625]|uniref:flagellar hook-basal body complex protein FliE n=1 Tax=Microbacterium jiangjiandongii TaxID=3049071 RepID=UPI00214C6327|nr:MULTISPECIES: flagellar hook-basal body complex protein FliE [unclassified Microbacterium]MCR2793229.1 flagellar hook-basal body complex protein FliE [Microbacterium sp. zg.Y625]WIM25392.1 flagellar hook-basal body complex protein FliE [Microbacterium sp. zg-Y625]
MPSIPSIDAIASSIPLPVAPPAPSPAGDGAFAQSITGAVDELRALQSTSNELAVAAVTGDLDDIHSAMIASSRASVTLELISAVRNKGVDAFNEIMRMQA